MVHELAFAFNEVPALFARNDDDVYDRISHRWTAALLICFALLVTTTTYVGDPIHCWVPVHFHGSWEKYSNSYCWIRNTYYLPFDEEIHTDLSQRHSQPIVYYQWVSLILMLQALLFYFPIVVWRQMNNDTGMDMNDIIETSEKVQRSIDYDKKEKLLGFLAKQIHRYLGMAKIDHRHSGWHIKTILKKIFGAFGKKYGNYVSAVYVIIKIWFLANVLGQLWLMNFFLGQDYSNYGVEVARAMWNGEDWTHSARFPRVTMCDLDVIRRLGNNHRYTIQCVLTVNLFNEKIYLFLWFWFIICAAFTFVGLLLLLIRSFAPNDRSRYIQKHLMRGHMKEDFDPDNRKHVALLDKYVNNYLRYDGVLLMRLVGHNTNKVTATDLICASFEYFTELPRVVKEMEDKFPGSDPEKAALTDATDDSSFD